MFLIKVNQTAMLMYDKMKGTKSEKFVANPKKGSMHNLGIAFDFTIVDGNGKEIDMGFTPFPKAIYQFTEEARRTLMIICVTS